MTCPHLEETSALFDGRPIDRAHADSCEECRAFLADAAQLRESLQGVTFATPRRRLAPILVPAALVLAVIAALLFRNDAAEERGPFAGLDGGGRAVIAVKDSK
jgi:predicted anti-sigma-YlaC factor YlaD